MGSLFDNPPTRPRTYVEGVDLDPNDLNQIFDRIISLVVDGLGVQGDREHGIAASRFVVTAGTIDPNTDLAQDGTFRGPMAFGDILCAAIDFVPTGNEITKVKFGFRFQAGNAGDLRFELIRQPITTAAAATTVATIDSDHTGPHAATGVDYVIELAPAHELEAGYKYQLRVVALAGVAVQYFTGALVTHKRDA